LSRKGTELSNFHPCLCTQSTRNAPKLAKTQGKLWFLSFTK
jgi:hypothetical protein